MSQEIHHQKQRQRWMSKAMVIKITGVTLLLLASFIIVSYYTDVAERPPVPSPTVVTPR